MRRPMYESAAPITIDDGNVIYVESAIQQRETRGHSSDEKSGACKGTDRIPERVPKSKSKRKTPHLLPNEVFSKLITQLFGGDKRDRTADLLNAIQALSQLSYTPVSKVILAKQTLNVNQKLAFEF